MTEAADAVGGARAVPAGSPATKPSRYSATSRDRRSGPCAAGPAARHSAGMVALRSPRSEWSRRKYSSSGTCWNRPTEGDLGDERPGGVVEPVLGADAAQHVGPHHAVLVVGAVGDDQAAEAFDGVSGSRCREIVELLHDRPQSSSMTALSTWLSTTSGCSSSTATQRASSLGRVEVVVRGPLEVRAAEPWPDQESLCWGPPRCCGLPDERNRWSRAAYRGDLRGPSVERCRR